MEWVSGWNGHLGGTGIWVERASGWNGHLGGTGIWVERASGWNGHLGGTGILPVTIPRRTIPTRREEAENQGKPLGGALRGYWLRS
ncbi:hypothetical protein BJP36_42210 [Moorena producens JHB]|uniref:Uncharacterized protein n=1 Tax=Moorena producens (strain JHB) TaxID=1454205 RepID=A0A9Q9SSS9_MOOP1|nr:hypothetical protein [Moorena producens]WAN68977.1 hypothetical protein BJP36_42210 [Moorena producens JHB]